MSNIMNTGADFEDRRPITHKHNNSLCIIIKNLPLVSEKDDIIRLLNKYGPIRKISLLKEWDHDLDHYTEDCYAFVELESYRSADLAIREISGTIYKGNEILLEMNAPPFLKRKRPCESPYQRSFRNTKGKFHCERSPSYSRSSRSSSNETEKSGRLSSVICKVNKDDPVDEDFELNGFRRYSKKTFKSQYFDHRQEYYYSDHANRKRHWKGRCKVSNSRPLPPHFRPEFDFEQRVRFFKRQKLPY